MSAKSAPRAPGDGDVARFVETYAGTLAQPGATPARAWRAARSTIRGVGEQRLRQAAIRAGLPLPAPAHRGRPRDEDVNAAVHAYRDHCGELLSTGAGDALWEAGVRHAALAAAIEGPAHPGLRSAVISRCRRDGIPLPPRGRPCRESAAIGAVLVAIWRFVGDERAGLRIEVTGERWRPLLPEQPTPTQRLLWRERAHVRRINALAPEARRAAVLRLARAARGPATM